ncbi:MAG: hypothetical protein U1E65_19620 [Myxococcota bacterium]
METSTRLVLAASQTAAECQDPLGTPERLPSCYTAPAQEPGLEVERTYSPLVSTRWLVRVALTAPPGAPLVGASLVLRFDPKHIAGHRVLGRSSRPQEDDPPPTPVIEAGRTAVFLIELEPVHPEAAPGPEPGLSVEVQSPAAKPAFSQQLRGPPHPLAEASAAQRVSVAAAILAMKLEHDWLAEEIPQSTLEAWIAGAPAAPLRQLLDRLQRAPSPIGLGPAARRKTIALDIHQIRDPQLRFRQEQALELAPDDELALVRRWHVVRKILAAASSSQASQYK